MPKKNKKTPPESEVAEELNRKALLFELDNVALKGRELVFDVLSGLLEEKGIKLSFGMFCQYCLYPPVKSYIPGILSGAGKNRFSPEKLAMEINDAVMMMFVDGNIKIADEFAGLLDSAKRAGAELGTFSVFEEESTGKILEKTGLKEVFAHCDSRDGKDLPSSDTWLKLAKKMKVPPSCCVVVASSSRSCKAALSAGMRCVVLADKFTSFQDFGGADWVTEAVDDYTVERVLGLLDF